MARLLRLLISGPPSPDHAYGRDACTVSDCQVFSYNFTAVTFNLSEIKSKQMSHFISKVKITGLWETDKAIEFDVDRRFNFLIGRNGSGKTTVINLIAAVLTGDLEKIEKTIFQKIEIDFITQIKSRKKSKITVTRTLQESSPFCRIDYEIKNSITSDTTIFGFGDFEETSFRSANPRFLRDRLFRNQSGFVQKILESFLTVNWLSVHRHIEIERSSEDRKNSSPVDLKLNILNNLLVRYFSQLSSEFAKETKEFQQQSFISLTDLQKEANIRQFVESIDVEMEKKSLESVFRVLGVDNKKTEKQVEQITKNLKSAKEPFINGQNLTISSLFAILNSYKAHSLVQLHEDLQKKRKEIYSTTDKFITVVNNLLAPRKIAKISAQNELVIYNQKGIPIELENLSSGEKQLLIILGQALLQDSKPVIYIADEPEISLHVEWQEKLINSISEINPNSQIVFATHSPDVVGAHQDKIIDMELVAA